MYYGNWSVGQSQLILIYSFWESASRRHHLSLTLYPIETPFDAFANRADPDQAALGRAAWSGSSLFMIKIWSCSLFQFHVQIWKFIYLNIHNGWSLAWIFMRERVKDKNLYSKIVIFQYKLTYMAAPPLKLWHILFDFKFTTWHLMVLKVTCWQFPKVNKGAFWFRPVFDLH